MTASSQGLAGLDLWKLAAAAFWLIVAAAVLFVMGFIFASSIVLVPICPIALLVNAWRWLHAPAARDLIAEHLKCSRKYWPVCRIVTRTMFRLAINTVRYLMSARSPRASGGR